MKTIIFFLMGFQAQAFGQSWADRIQPAADLRFRGEYISDGVNEVGSAEGDTERLRLRVRARLQMTFKINEEFDLIMRAATGSASVTTTATTNLDLTGYGSRKDFNLDLAYGRWHPSETTQVWFGKTPVPFFTPGGSDLLFDVDLTPEGVSYKDRFNHDRASMFWNLSVWQMNERHDSTTPEDKPDVILAGGDVGTDLKTGAGEFTLGVGYLNFMDIRGSPAGTTGAPTARGNTTVVDGANLLYVYKYEVARVFAEYRLNWGEMPVTFYVDGAKNQDPDEDNAAYLVGVKVGKIGPDGKWSALLDHRALQKDSTVGLITDDGVASGGTDLSSVRFIASYALRPGTVLGLVYIDGRRFRSTFDSDYRRAMLEINLVF
jgi:hypothetical protein